MTNSLRFKITASYLVTLALILAPLGAVAYSYTREDLTRDSDQDLRTTASMLMVRLATRTNDAPKPTAESVLVTELAQMDHYGITSADEGTFLRLSNRLSGLTLFASKGLRHSVLVERLAHVPVPSQIGTDVRFAGTPRESLVRVLTTAIPNTDDVLQVAVAWDRYESQLDAAALRIAIAVTGFLILSAIGVYRLIVRALDPVAQIVAQAERLSADSMPTELLPPAPTTDTEIRDLVTALNRMMARLQRAAERRRQFTADAAHELRTPLTIMQGEMEVALLKERTGERYRRTIESSLEEVKRLSRIVRDLGILARSDDGGNVIEHPRAIDLGSLAGEVTQNFNVIADEREIVLRCSGSPDSFILGDVDSITRLIGNLVGNALNYTRSGGSIDVLVTARDEAVQLAVSDTGVGIAVDDLPHVFNRFYRADKARVNSGGHGLGLAIVKGIAEAHGGSVDCQSEVGAGSTFRATFPKSRPATTPLKR